MRAGCPPRRVLVEGTPTCPRSRRSNRNMQRRPDPMPAKPRQSPCRPNRRRPIDSLDLRATGRRPRFPLMNQLSPGQVRQFQSLAAVYRADLLDPGAWEALLLLLEICNILDLLPGVVERIFGPGMRARIET